MAVGVAGLILVLPAAARAGTQVTYYAAADGSGSTCSQTSPCSLTGARDKARLVSRPLTGDIRIELAGGTYTLGSTLALTASDSGDANGDVIWEAAPGATPILSGGAEITGWSTDPLNSNIKRASVGTSVDFRQLYVNGVRATRARGNPATFTKNTSIHGWTASNSTMASWGNPSNIELVGQKFWKVYRCPVESVSGTSVVSRNPCFSNSQLHAGHMWDAVDWVENAYQLLDTPGEWYLDRTSGYVYYWPRAGEDMSKATVVRPDLQTLVSITGSLSTPVTNIRFQGITFAFSNWTHVNGNDGYVPLQAGFHYEGTKTSADAFTVTKTPGAVTVDAGQSLDFTRNTFIHLGATGLTLDDGAQYDTVDGNVFTDLSSAAIGLGDAGGSANSPSDSRAQVANDTLKDNYVTAIGAEYFDNPAITVAYARNATIAHNFIEQMPYTGISVGWGWGLRTSYMTTNAITANRILNPMLTLVDGGGVYTLSSQPSSTITGNYIAGDYAPYGNLYLDQASQGFTASSNVVGPTDTNWLYLQTGLTGNTVTGNYSSTTSKVTQTGNTVSGNSEGLTSWPSAAQTIIDASGLESTYADIADPRSSVDDASLTYTGTGWTHDTGLNSITYSGGTSSYSKTTNNTVTLSFTGSGVRIYGATQSNLGIAGISIDGGTEQLVDLYSATGRYGRLLYQNAGLTPGSHTLTVRVTGTKNASATDSYVSLDRVTYVPGTTVDDPSFTYTGTWTHATGLDTTYYGGGTLSYSNATNATASYTFTGTRLSIYAPMQYNLGIMGVTVDSRPEDLVDLYRTGTRYGTRVYNLTGLSAGSHTVTLRVTGTKNAASSATYAQVDRLVAG